MILACDGLKDYVQEHVIIEQMEKYNGNNLAKALVDYAINEASSFDNVTVQVIQVE